MLREEEHIKDIDANEFAKVFTPEIKQVIKVIREYGFDLRVVGGAVRDFLRGQSPRDVDFATDADPSELIYMLQLAGIDFNTSGIRHGTIKAIFGDYKVDISSLAFRIKVANNAMKIDKSTSWEQDAMRRDLTINSLSMDLNGRIYDYVGGLEDLHNHILRFNKVIPATIPDDPHLMMRWFKALGYFDDPKWPSKDLDAIKKNLPLLAKIKNDSKTAKEMTSILSSPRAKNIVKMMCKLDANRYLDLSCDL